MNKKHFTSNEENVNVFLHRVTKSFNSHVPITSRNSCHKLFDPEPLVSFTDVGRVGHW